ncbi:MAG: STN domain-containing protein, partial [Bacteroidota bacterium]
MNKPKKANNAVPLMVVFILLCISLLQSNFAFTQTTPDPFEQIINFKAQNEPLRQVLETLGEKYDLNFTYNADDPSFDTKVNLNIHGKKTSDILKAILKQTGHDHKIVGNHLVILQQDEDHKKTEKFADANHDLPT